MDNGKVLIYYGKGHGKSTAAMGNVIHAASLGQSATVIQFLKGKDERGQEYLKRLEPEIKFFSFTKSGECFTDLSRSEQKDEIMNQKNGFSYGRKVISTGACDIVVLDEFLGLVDLGLVDIEEVRQMLAMRPDDMTIILTGRVLDDRLRDFADEIYNIASEK